MKKFPTVVWIGKKDVTKKYLKYWGINRNDLLAKYCSADNRIELIEGLPTYLEPFVIFHEFGHYVIDQLNYANELRENYNLRLFEIECRKFHESRIFEDLKRDMKDLNWLLKQVKEIDNRIVGKRRTLNISKFHKWYDKLPWSKFYDIIERSEVNGKEK